MMLSAQPAVVCAIAIGASAGGVPALKAVLSSLPRDLPAAVLVVLHLDRHHKSVLPAVLAPHVRLPVKHAVNLEPIHGGTVYLGVPNLHLLVAHGRIELTDTALVHFTRPSIDLLFDSVAHAYADGAVGVILTGTGHDGAAGLTTIKRSGGTTIVEDPATAAHPAMPLAALATGSVDHTLSLGEIGPALVGLAAATATRHGTA